MSSELGSLTSLLSLTCLWIVERSVWCLYINFVLIHFFRPLSPASVVPAVSALLNHLLCQIDTEKMGKGLLYCFYSLNLRSLPQTVFFKIVRWVFWFIQLTGARLPAPSPSSRSLRGQTGPELPPQSGRLCPAPLSGYCGQGHLNLQVCTAPSTQWNPLYTPVPLSVTFIIVVTGGFPLTCPPCCWETSTTPACHSAAFQSIYPTMHCWRSSIFCTPTSPPTSLRFVSSHTSGKEKQLFQLLFWRLIVWVSSNNIILLRWWFSCTSFSLIR